METFIHQENMENFIHRENIAIFTRRLAETKDVTVRGMLLQLLAATVAGSGAGQGCAETREVRPRR
jgi:hypothetical protein